MDSVFGAMWYSFFSFTQFPEIVVLIPESCKRNPPGDAHAAQKKAAVLPCGGVQSPCCCYYPEIAIKNRMKYNKTKE